MNHQSTLSKLRASNAAPSYAPAPVMDQAVEDQLHQIYGATLTKNLFEPILRKYYGCSLDRLVPDAHHVMGLSRILGFTPSASRFIAWVLRCRFESCAKAF